MSEIRHLADGKMHIAGYYPDALRVITNPDENYTFSSQTLFSNPAYALTYYMPMQKVIKSLPPDGPQENVFTRTLKEKVYELTDHLGNVRAVVSDEKHVTLTAGVPGDFEPDVIAGNNYYAFGMLMPGRSFRSDEYRYGFQGQEKDDEIKGAGNSINYKYRMHDPRLGRFFAVDPLFKEYSWNSSYAFSENRVIDGVEIEGLEYGDVDVVRTANGREAILKPISYREVMGSTPGLQKHIYEAITNVEGITEYKKTGSYIDNSAPPPKIDDFNNQFSKIDQSHLNSLVSWIAYDKSYFTTRDLKEQGDEPNTRNYGYSPKMRSGLITVSGSDNIRVITVDFFNQVLDAGEPFNDNSAIRNRAIIPDVYKLEDVSDGNQILYYQLSIPRPSKVEDGFATGMSNTGSAINMRFQTAQDRTDFTNTYMQDAQEVDNF